jgi:excisionase family DNA binding protein
MTTAEAPSDALAYSVPMAARLIGVGPQRAWDLIREGAIRSFMSDGRRLISRHALDEYIASQENGLA